MGGRHVDRRVKVYCLNGGVDCIQRRRRRVAGGAQAMVTLRCRSLASFCYAIGGIESIRGCAEKRRGG
jgi:hypothetical protein